MIVTFISVLSLAIWIWMLVGRGEFWRVSSAMASPETDTPATSRIAIVVPARNEADVIGRTIRSLVEQDYPGRFQIFLVDDHSSDGTAAAAADAAGNRSELLRVVSSSPLPSGWTGKMWAMSQGVECAGDFKADYFLFTDADIVHERNSLRSLATTSEAGGYDLVSTMAKLSCSSFAERALIPAFVFFFFMLYPPRWVRSRKKKVAGAAGGNILVRAAALARIGGVAAIRNELIDDCALAREIKKNGSVWLGLTTDVLSIRVYEGFGDVGRMISRTAFYQLRHSVWLLMGTLLGLAITYFAPPVLVFFGGWAAASGGTAWLLMSIAFWPMLKFYSRSPIWALLLPLIALFYMGATIHSALQYWSGRGGEWKGRAQDVRLAG